MTLYSLKIIQFQNSVTISSATELIIICTYNSFSKAFTVFVLFSNKQSVLGKDDIHFEYWLNFSTATDMPKIWSNNMFFTWTIYQKTTPNTTSACFQTLWAVSSKNTGISSQPFKTKFVYFPQIYLVFKTHNFLSFAWNNGGFSSKPWHRHIFILLIQNISPGT